MGRRGFGSVMMAAARASARAARQAEAEHRRSVAAQVRYEKAQQIENLRAQKEYEKQIKQEYLESRINEVADLTSEAETTDNYFRTGIIPETLEIDDVIDFSFLKPKKNPPKFEPPRTLTVQPAAPKLSDFTNHISGPNLFEKIIPYFKQKHIEKHSDAQKSFESATEKWKKRIASLEKEFAIFRSDYETKLKAYNIEYSNKCKEVDDFENAYRNGDPEAVISYINMVLENSYYKEEWDRKFETAYSEESKEVLIEMSLPTIDIVPNCLEFKYVKTRDKIEEKARKRSETDLTYKYLISNIAIRTIHEVVESDQVDSAHVISFNGYVETMDKCTGHKITPTIISVTTTKEVFKQFKLENIDPVKCVQGLSASISSAPGELVPVKPIREFSMVDKRYVEEQDVASTIDSRPNLMDLNPFEFENLVSNLFSKMGLETKQTRSSKDGGIDAVAFDTRPVLGGKVVIQAKRYKNTVGVAAVRDLYGTMINEGASKGILVSTSGYGPDAFEFAKDKPVELIEGSALLYLLQQVGINAKIIMPTV